MLNVESATTESDEIRNMLSSARRQTNVSIAMPEGIFHRAMSRKKSLVEDDLMNAFSLPPIPLDSDIETSSSESESSEEEEEPPVIPSPKAPKKDLIVPTPAPKEQQPSKKVSFLKTRSASAHLLNVPNRLGKAGRRLSLSNILRNTEEDQVVTIGKSGVSKLGSRRSSLPLVADFIRRSPKLELKTSLPDIDETKDQKHIENNMEKQKNVEEESAEDRLGPPSDEDMALGLNRNSSGDDPNSFKSTNVNNEERKGRKSVKQVFKKSFFKSKRGSKKADQSQSSGSSKSDDKPSRLFQRRPSRLEMGIPIEEVFSGIEFKKVEKKPSPTTSTVEAKDDESDAAVEDPDEVIVQMKADELEATLNCEQEKLAQNFSSLTSEGHDLERKKV